MKTKMETKLFGGWVRREWTTRCSDPTVVVEWHWGRSIVLTEFFGDVSVELGATRISNQLGAAIHKMLETLNNAKEESECWAGVDVEEEVELAVLELRRQREMRHCDGCGQDYNPKQSLPKELREFDYLVPPSVCPECGHEDCPTVEEYLEAHAEDGLEN